LVITKISWLYFQDGFPQIITLSSLALEAIPSKGFLIAALMPPNFAKKCAAEAAHFPVGL